MANGHGGYRKPEHPAPVSPPGQLSRRTDGGPAQKLRPITGLGYGQNQALNEAQAAAPLAQTSLPGDPGVAQATAQPAPPSVVPFGAATQRPNEPVTAGSPLGPGPGPTPMGVNPTVAAYQSAQASLTTVLQGQNSPEAQALLQSLQGQN